MSNANEVRITAKYLESHPLTHFLVRSDSWPRYWGKGETVAEAIKAARYIQPGTPVVVYRCDSEAWMDEMVTMHFFNRIELYRGDYKRGGKITIKV